MRRTSIPKGPPIGLDPGSRSGLRLKKGARRKPVEGGQIVDSRLTVDPRLSAD